MVDSLSFIGYNHKTMSWWSMITTQGRLLQGVCVDFTKGELRIVGLTLEEGEEIAVLIDHLCNQARLYAPLKDCQRLAALHYYELVGPRRPQETLTDHIQRFLSMIQRNEEEPSPPEDGELGFDSI